MIRLDIKRLLLGAICLSLLAVTVQAAILNDTGEEVQVPIIMYHALLKDTARHGRYVVSPEVFERDLVYLKEHGYTPVFIEDLICYTKGEELPEKPVVITFDDGYYNNYVYAYEIARRLTCKIVISPIGRWADYYTETGEENAYYTHATWARLKEMVDSGLVELQNHSYDSHTVKGRTGVKRCSGESLEAYEDYLRSDLQMAQEAIRLHTGRAPTAMVYPFGAYNASTAEIVKTMGFSATLTCEEKIPIITRDPESLFGLGRFLRPAGISTEAFFEETVKLP